MRIIGNLMVIGASVLMYLFGRMWFSRAAGLLSALLLQILPMFHQNHGVFAICLVLGFPCRYRIETHHGGTDGSPEESTACPSYSSSPIPHPVQATAKASA